MSPQLRAIYAPHGRRSHWLDEATGRTLCGLYGDRWPFDGPNGDPDCAVCAKRRAAPTEGGGAP